MFNLSNNTLSIYLRDNLKIMLQQWEKSTKIYSVLQKIPNSSFVSEIHELKHTEFLFHMLYNFRNKDSSARMLAVEDTLRWKIARKDYQEVWTVAKSLS